MLKRWTTIFNLIVDTVNLLVPNASGSELQVHKGELLNVWIGSASTHPRIKSSDLLERDLDKINSSLHITTSLNDLFHAVYKEFNFTSNYPKDRG